MKIKEVEEIVGISSKNIRFYEECGLLEPERQNNGYREYDENAIDLLKKIKLLRLVGISVENIKKILNGQTSLTSALNIQMKEVKKAAGNLENTAVLIQSVVASSPEINTIEAGTWLERIESMKKEGTDFVDIAKEDVHVKKKAGAIVFGIVMIILMGFFIGIILWANKTDPMPAVLLVMILLIPVAVIFGVLYVIIKRVKEIDGGEEDEASKY